MRTKLLIIFLILMASIGCFSDTKVEVIGEQAREPFEGRVFITELDIPRPANYESRGSIEVNGDLTDSKDAVLARVANIARNMGANAVIRVRTWRTRSIGIHHNARGEAIIVSNDTLALINGEWW